MGQNESISGEQTDRVLCGSGHIRIDQQDELGEYHVTRFTWFDASHSTLSMIIQIYTVHSK